MPCLKPSVAIISYSMKIRTAPSTSVLTPTLLVAGCLTLLQIACPRVIMAQEPIPAPPDIAAPPQDAQVTQSGLASKVLIPGKGTDHPDATSHVIVHYTAWKQNGDMFDSSVARRKKASLELSVMIDGFIEGLQQMVTGETRRLWIPPDLAYRGIDGKPQGMLVFDVELFDFVATPLDVAEPPADAQRGKSGLAWKVLRPGTGSVNPPKKSTSVTVHYSGWTTDGEMFDSSVTRGSPTTFKLNQVIRGWTEGVRLMVEGEKRRFWIPAKMAYKGVPDRPQGTLVFDIELISIN